MDLIMMCMIGFWIILVCCFVYYSATTNKIIKEQEREIASLTTENKRLKSILQGMQNIEKMVLYKNRKEGRKE